MVVPFGFSVGDIISGTSTLIQCFEAFRATGGAADEYNEATSFLEGMKTVLEWTKLYIDEHPDGTHADKI
jgi:hypothetical protein